ncbi:MAG: TolC family protein [Ekhidna sp.]|nr:TolC family protein [Ekhidna sp.]
MKTKLILCLLGFLPTILVSGQELLSKTDAVALMMERNFAIRLTDLDVKIAKNNTNLLNSGYLPTLSANGNLNYNIDNSDLVFNNGADTTIRNAESDGRALNINANYILFDGFNRKYNVSRNRENLSISQLNSQATLENTLVTLYTNYYAVAQSQQSVYSLKQSLNISKDRLRRLEYGFEYGRNTKLDVSNAQVDVNTDSINYLNAQQLLKNQIRDLNLTLGIVSDEMYVVDTAVTFNATSSKETYMESLEIKNTQIQLAKSGVNVSMYDNQISKRNYFPTISLNGGYSNGVNNFAPGNFLTSRTNAGVTYGASFTWNLFDGGGSTVANQNARVNVNIQETSLEQTKQEVNASFANAWSNYKNQLFIIEALQKNVDANQQNFERTREKFQLGQVSSLDFRTSQLNLLQAKLNLIEARYNAKISEVTVYQLAGDIQEVSF